MKARVSRAEGEPARRKERPKAGRVDTKILSMDSAGRHGHHAHQVAPETLRGDEHGPSMLSRPVSRSVVSSSVTAARRALRSVESLGKNTGVDSHSLGVGSHGSWSGWLY